jgi:hypothetical protein
MTTSALYIALTVSRFDRRRIAGGRGGYVVGLLLATALSAAAVIADGAGPPALPPVPSPPHSPIGRQRTSDDALFSGVDSGLCAVLIAVFPLHSPSYREFCEKA